jgi:hypothetical protein
MFAIRDSTDEPYFLHEETDNQLNRTYWKVLACPASGCSDASLKKAYLRSFISRNRLVDYLALHLHRSSLHDYQLQTAFDTAANWVEVDENVVEITETFAHRQEYREQAKHAYSMKQKAASRPRTPSRGREASAENREPGHGRSQIQERSRSMRRVGNRLIEVRPPRGPPPDIVINTPGPSQNIAIGNISKAGILLRQWKTKQTASSSGGSAGSAGDTVDKSQLQLLHGVLTRAHGALNMGSKACEALRRNFHDESEVIDEARAAVKTIMER